MKTEHPIATVFHTAGTAGTILYCHYTALSLALFSVFAISCCSPLAVYAADESIKLQVGGLDRTCLLHVPPTHDEKSQLPLVIVLHGSGGNGKQIAGITGFSDLSDKYSFIAAYPDVRAGKHSAWNSLYGKVPGGEGVLSDDVDDVAFIRRLVEFLHTTHHIDLNRVYVCGWSSGAYMSYRVAIDLPDIFAAAGVVCGAIGIKSIDGQPVSAVIPEPNAPISILQISGRLDTNVKFEGGQFPKNLCKSTPECVQLFVRSNGCSINGVETVDATRGVTRTVYSGGRDGTEVQLMIVDKCGHTWPKQSIHGGISASEELWEFFSKHPKFSRFNLQAVPTEITKPSE